MLDHDPRMILAPRSPRSATDDPRMILAPRSPRSATVQPKPSLNDGWDALMDQHNKAMATEV